MRRTGKVFDLSTGAHERFQCIYGLSSFGSSEESHLSSLDSVRRAERLCKGELYSLAHRRKVNALLS